MKRHIAITNTGQRIVVVFMQIPGKEDHALVISSDNLPPRWEQYVMQIVESSEGQSDPDLGNVLGRRLMPDTTDTVLAALHKTGLLHPIHIDRVTMMPKPNMPYSLRTILQAMNRMVPDEYEIAAKLNETAQVAARDHVAEIGGVPSPNALGAPLPAPSIPDELSTKFNPHTTNQTASVSEHALAVAQNLLFEAQLLENDATAKRNKAYQYAPHLRPQPQKPKTVAPPPVQQQAVEAPVKAPKPKVTRAKKAAV